jgi:hypothetical protein
MKKTDKVDKRLAKEEQLAEHSTLGPGVVIHEIF